MYQNVLPCFNIYTLNTIIAIYLAFHYGHFHEISFQMCLCMRLQMIVSTPTQDFVMEDRTLQCFNNRFTWSNNQWRYGSHVSLT